MELLHFLSKLYIHVTHVWEIYNVKEGEERVARDTNGNSELALIQLITYIT